MILLYYNHICCLSIFDFKGYIQVGHNLYLQNCTHNLIDIHHNHWDQLENTNDNSLLYMSYRLHRCWVKMANICIMLNSEHRKWLKVSVIHKCFWRAYPECSQPCRCHTLWSCSRNTEHSLILRMPNKIRCYPEQSTDCRNIDYHWYCK